MASPTPRRAPEGPRSSSTTELTGSELISRSFGQILVLQADVGEGSEFRLGGHHRPDYDGEGQREQFPAEILEQQIPDPLERAHDIEQAIHGCTRSTGGLRVASVGSGISPAKSVDLRRRGATAPRSAVDAFHDFGYGEPGGQFAEGGHRNAPGLLGDHEGEAIGLFGDADGGAMARAQLAREGAGWW